MPSEPTTGWTAKPCDRRRPADEARAWLGADAPPVRTPMTLADLFAHGRADDVIRHRAATPAPGQYL